MAAASCVQEEKEDKEAPEPSDAIAQGTCLHTQADTHPVLGVRPSMFTAEDEVLLDCRLGSLLVADPRVFTGHPSGDKRHVDHWPPGKSSWQLTGGL